MKIAFVYMKGRLDKLEKVRSGSAASDFFYGGVQLKEMGHDAGLFEVDSATGGSISRKILVLLADRLFALRLLPSRTYGWLIFAVKDLLPQLNKYDVIVATTTGIAFAIGLWRQLGLVEPPIVGIQGSLIDYKHNWFKKKLNGFLLKRMRTQLLGNENAAESLCQDYNLPSDIIAVNQFGIDSEFWSPDLNGGSEAEDSYILSVGNDGRRDYDLLIKSAHMINSKIRIVTSNKISANVPDNVSITPCDWGAGDITEPSLRELFRKATIVVIPLRETSQVSGQSAALQAMACGKPVVLSKTSGLWSKSMLKDWENVVFVPPSDADELAKNINRLVDDRDARKRIGKLAYDTVKSEANIDRFAKQLVKECEMAVSYFGK